MAKQRFTRFGRQKSTWPIRTRGSAFVNLHSFQLKKKKIWKIFCSVWDFEWTHAYSQMTISTDWWPEFGSAPKLYTFWTATCCVGLRYAMNDSQRNCKECPCKNSGDSTDLQLYLVPLLNLMGSRYRHTPQLHSTSWFEVVGDFVIVRHEYVASLS